MISMAATGTECRHVAQSVDGGQRAMAVVVARKEALAGLPLPAATAMAAAAPPDRKKACCLPLPSV